MLTFKTPSWYLFSLLASLATANMQYTFTTNGTCPGVGRPWDCDPFTDVICGEETSRGQAYCCPYEYDLCGTGSTTCSGKNGQAGNGQIDCNAEGAHWCCVAEYETCTQRLHQINVCLYNVDKNPYVGLDPSVATRLYSSVITASPSASFNSAQIKSLISEASPTLSATSTPTSSPTNSNPASTSPSVGEVNGVSPTSAPDSDDRQGLSGGAIGGIVVAVVVLVAVVAGLAWFFLRRKRGQVAEVQKGEYQQAPQSTTGYYGQTWSEDRKEAPMIEETSHELESYQQRAELTGGNEHTPIHELPGR